MNESSKKIWLKAARSANNVRIWMIAQWIQVFQQKSANSSDKIFLENSKHEYQAIRFHIEDFIFKCRASAGNALKAAPMPQSSLDVPVRQRVSSTHHEYIAVICVLFSFWIWVSAGWRQGRISPTIRDYNNVQNSGNSSLCTTASVCECSCLESMKKNNTFWHLAEIHRRELISLFSGLLTTQSHCQTLSGVRWGCRKENIYPALSLKGLLGRRVGNVATTHWKIIWN